MVNRFHSGPAHLEWPSIIEESIHMEQRVRSKVHKEAPWLPSPRPQGEQSSTSTDDPSCSNREKEVERLREQVEELQREAEKDKELLYRKDEELHRRRGLSLAHSRS